MTNNVSVNHLSTYQTRKKHLIEGKKQKLKRASLSVLCKGPQVWNELDKDLQMSPSVFVFKKKITEALAAEILCHYLML